MSSGSMLDSTDSGNEVDEGTNLAKSTVWITGIMYQFRDPYVRGSFLEGKIIPDADEAMLSELDRMVDFLMAKVAKSVDSSVISQKVNFMKSMANGVSDLVDDNFSFLHSPRSFSKWFGYFSRIANSDFWDDYFGSVNPILPTNSGIKQLTESEDKSKIIPGESLICDANGLHKKSTRPKLPNVTKPGITNGLQTLHQDTDCSLSTVSITSSEDSIRSRTYRRRRGQYDVVQPASFNMNSGVSLRKFLKIYEKYFYRKFDGNQYEMSTELGKFLSEELLHVYRINGGSDVKYGRMKIYLLEFYDSQRSVSSRHWKQEFESCRMFNDESVLLYAMRLRNIAEKAFMHSVKDREKELNWHFLKTVPTWFRNKMESVEEITKRLDGRKLSWSDRVNLAKEEERKSTRYLDKAKVFYGSNARSVRPRNEYKPAGNFRNGKLHSEDFIQRRKKSEPDIAPSNNFRKSDFQDRRRKFESLPTIQCNFCGRMGHEVDNCRLYKSQCLICGQDGHFRKDCPRYKPRFKCPVCSADHLGKFCPNLKKEALNTKALDRMGSAQSIKQQN